MQTRKSSGPYDVKDANTSQVAKTWEPTLNGTCINQVASYFGEQECSFVLGNVKTDICQDLADQVWASTS